MSRAFIRTLSSGDLREVVSIQRAVETQDDTGANTTSWITVATVRARVETISARELVQAQQIAGTITHRVVMRYAPDIGGVTQKDRLLFGSRVLNVVAVLERGLRRDELEILCAEEA